MRLPCKGPQPLRYGTGRICGECTKFRADACLLIDRKPFLRACDGTVPTKERGHVDSETRIANPSAETRDVRADARHLSHDDYRRTRTRNMHDLGHVAERDLAPCEVVEGVIIVEAADRKSTRLNSSHLGIS